METVPGQRSYSTCQQPVLLLLLPPQQELLLLQHRMHGLPDPHVQLMTAHPKIRWVVVVVVSAAVPVGLGWPVVPANGAVRAGSEASQGQGRNVTGVGRWVDGSRSLDLQDQLHHNGYPH
jgi:hypothetical protein